jgi:hypothetical protein
MSCPWSFHVHFLAACPFPCCMLCSSCIWTCSVEMVLQHGHGHAARKGACSMDMDSSINMDMRHEHGHEHAAWTSTRSMVMDMQHGLELRHAARPSPCYMSKPILPVHVHAAFSCPCCIPVPCCMFMNILDVHVIVYAACLCLYIICPC